MGKIMDQAALALGALALTASSGCSRTKPLEVKATAKMVSARGGTDLQIDVVTEPGAEVWALAEGGKHPCGTADPQGAARCTFGPELAEVSIGAKLGARTGGVAVTLPSAGGRVVPDPTAGPGRWACRGALPCALAFQADGSLRVSRAPAGTRVSVGDGAPVTVGPGDTSAPVSLAKALGPVSPARLFGGTDSLFELSLPVRLEGQGKVVEGTLSVGQADAKRAAAGYFLGIERGPVALSPEGSGRATVVVFVDTTATQSHTASLVGAAPTASAIGFVAVLRGESTRSKDCGVYAGRAASTRVRATEVDGRVTLYDRRSGAVKGKQMFRAPPASCPSRVQGAKTVAVGTSYDANAVLAWVTKQTSG